MCAKVRASMMFLPADLQEEYLGLWDAGSSHETCKKFELFGKG